MSRQETTTEQIAQEWLALIDVEKFEDAHSAASDYLQENISAEQLGVAIRGAREDLLAGGKRKLIGSQRFDKLPDAPPGDYIVSQYESRLENDANRIETLTLVLQDAQWKVVGYFINNQ
ncbi:MAG: DUF4019 domain-containing protein [Pseudomonadota bacterium]